MKIRFFILFIVLSFASFSQTSKHAESNFRPGEVWYDTDENPINAHSAGILFHNGTYYWFGEIKSGKTWLVPGQTWECYRTNAGGISCYSSKNLTVWKFEGVALAPNTLDSTSDIHTSKVIERPKVVYNEGTKKFVMWMHIDSEDYAYSRAGVAVSDNPAGPYSYIGSMRPNGQMSRDMTLFKDDDGKAYHIFSSEMNATMHISLLTDDYLNSTGEVKRIFVEKSREAPAMFKRNGKYYLITSGCTGWSPNPAMLASADSIFGNWTELYNPCIGPNGDSTFFAQSTFVLPIENKPDEFIFMADRWNKTNLEDSRYVWLPMVFRNDSAEIEWKESWSLGNLNNEQVNSLGSENLAGDTLFDVVEVLDHPVMTKNDPGTDGNKFGFEGGRVVKVGHEYHIFTTEMYGEPVWCKTRLAHWKSKDGISWARNATIFESTGDFTGNDSHAALWSPMPTFDEKQNCWILTYVCYRSKPNTAEKWYRNYDGIIAYAASTVKGIKGIGGPYTEVATLMRADNSEPKLGLMGVDSFFPYEMNGQWLAFYGSSPEWNGLAKASSLRGPWKRIGEAGIVSQHTENPVVQKLNENLYIAFFDGCGVYQKFGYMVSSDGLHWSKPIIINLEDHPHKWWGLTRTPLGLIDEGEGNYTLYFSAYNKNFYQIPGIWEAKSDSVFNGFFASIGTVKLRLNKRSPK